MATDFVHINKKWNAEPNAPMEMVDVKDSYVSLSFTVNPWAYEGFEEEQRAEIRFYGASMWRLGATNDEGWYSGQCRFSKLVLRWGEFYEVKGNALLERSPNDWHQIGQGKGNKHFLFYLRDSTFECEAESYEFISSYT